MSLLNKLLHTKEPLLQQTLDQLEAASHKQGIDARLIADIHQKVAKTMHLLKLDVKDTTPGELYHALLSKAADQEIILINQIGVKAQTDFLFAAERTIKLAKAPTDAWVLKKSVAKELLRAMPPKNVMQLLGYRSIDSMLKREKISVIYGALRFAQSPQWLNNFNKNYCKLKPSDFEVRKIEIIELKNDPWIQISQSFIAKKRHNLTHLKELGVILVLPDQKPQRPGRLLWDLALTLHYINEIRLYSSFFKLQQVKKDFGCVLANTIIADPDLGKIMAGQNIHWRVVQRYFGKLEAYHPEIFEPHVQPEDLHWRRAEDSLFVIAPPLKFWKDLDYVATMAADGPVSFNLLDVAASLAGGAAYENRNFYHFRESLWNEIFVRYMGQGTLEQQVLKCLSGGMIAPEDLEPEQ